jgi:hypothetical protein
MAELTFSIDAERLHHAFRFVRGDDSPPHPKFADALTRVLIEPHPKNGVYMIGCDGNIMVIQFDPSGSTSAPFCLGLNAAERALLRGDNIRRRTLSLENGEDHMSVKTAGQRSSELHKGQFVHGDSYPKWRSVLPNWSDLRPGMPGKLNAHYLGVLVAMANPGQSTQKTFDMYCAQSGINKEKAAIIFFPFNPNMLAVLMPMMGTADTPHAEPEWLNPTFDPADDL